MNPKTILLAEDDARALEVLATLLREEGFEVVPVADGGAALELLGAREFSLVITDLNMPRATGVDLVVHLRARDVRTPVILISADGDAIARAQSETVGASDYITKPIKVDDLLVRVERLLQSPGA